MVNSKDKEDSSNGYKNLNSWQRCLIEVGRTFGVPSVLLLLIVYWLLWQVTPPVINAFSTFLDSTVTTQKSLADTQSEIAASQAKLVGLVEAVQEAANEIVQSEQATTKFMMGVEQDHKTQLNDLKEIKEAVSRPATATQPGTTPEGK
jgi:low affinity Fe/Cu permease